MSDANEPKSLIAADMEISGTIKTSSAVRIEGKLEGELISTGDVVVGKSAIIKGNLSVNSVVVEGQIQGNVSAKDKVEMKSSCKVQGDIVSKRMTVDDGVTFIGRSEVNPSGAPAAAPVASAKPAPAAPAKPAGEEKAGETPPASAFFGRRQG